MTTSRELINQEAQRAAVLIESATMSHLTTYTVGPESIRVRFTKAGAIWSAVHIRPDGSSRAIHGGVGAVLGVLFGMLERQVGATPPLPQPLAEHFTTDPGAIAYERAVDGLAPASAPERGTDAFDEVERSDQAAAEFERTAGRPASPRFTVLDIQAADLRKGDRLQAGLGQFTNTVARIELVDEAADTHVHIWLEGQTGPAAWYVFPEDARVRIQRTASERSPLYDSAGQIVPMITVDLLGGNTFELARWDVEEGTHVHLATLSRQEAADACYALAIAFSRIAD